MENLSLELIEKFENALLSMDHLEVRQILKQENQNQSPITTIEQLIVPTLERIGNSWESGKVSLSQVYMSGRICEEMVDTFLPPSDPLRSTQPAMAIAVLDDYHLLGKRIVYSVLRASGIELLDYGHVDVDTLTEQVIKDEIQILLISVLMLPSALHIKELRKALKNEHKSIKILVGGAPFRFDQRLCMEVGADGTGNNAAEAIALVKKTIEEIL